MYPTNDNMNHLVWLPLNSIWPAGYLPAGCVSLHRLLRAWFAPAVQWNFGIVANSVYITEKNLSEARNYQTTMVHYKNSWGLW